LLKKESRYTLKSPYLVQTQHALRILKYSCNLISVMSGKLWNKLPKELAEEDRLPFFKHKLKNHMLIIPKSIILISASL